MVKVEMVCRKCDNIVEAETSATHNTRKAIVIYDHTTYICTECGAIMTRRVVKTETKETETIISEGN